ncbi:MAG: MmcQ/YjbR family DNA-binding protein [Mesorhizobium sp.]|nr:MmcQ/YjbR family DNA-binding protein [Mesorhizobium sp.]MBN9241832.1 MmcQ/YjbR family DNA-binding protein [Mesorhizobium sp.]MBN9269983.1 MmcQ/YjbR family DNA-binding protein [Mesorhizobium sp.]
MVSAEAFRATALGLPDAEQSGHFDVTDFRVHGKIFATWRDKDSRAVLKLTPDQQRLLGETAAGLFAPVAGAWGLKGWTLVTLDKIDAATLGHAMQMAWRNVAPKSLP